jgi:DNA-directed RNA polymerase
MNSDLYSIEQSNELDGIEQGVARYRYIASQRRSVHNTPERKIIGKALERMVPAIEAEKRRILKAMKSRGRPGTWWPPFMVISSDKLALITLAEMLDWRDERKSTSIQIDVAGGVRTELMYDAIRAHNKERFGQTEIRKKNWSDLEIRKIYKKAGMKPIKWTISDKLLLGGALVRIAVDSTKMFNLRYCKTHGPQREVRIEPKPEVLDELLSQHSNLEILKPVLPPMLVPPVDWTTEGTGGYLFIQKPLVRDAFGNHEVDYDIPSMQVPLEALNYIQSTPWRINGAVLDIMQRLWSNGGGVAGLPPATSEAVPKGEKHGREFWRRRDQDNSRRFSTIRTLSIAHKYRDQDIWFPHNLDFRGRVYPLPSYLHPQGDDLCRGLLMFSETLALGKTGLFSLMISLANSAGMDKISVDDRIKWTMDNWVKHYAKRSFDPYEDKRWMQYDDPVQFVAAMLDLNAALLSGSPETHMSSVCVYIDGSNNGLQHLSALTRDEVGGEAVNLVPSPVPQDMYDRVAKAVNELIRRDAATKPAKSEHDTPEPWTVLKDQVTRKMVKRCTLAYPYGISGFGMKLALIQDGDLDDMADNTRTIAGYLARSIRDAIGNVVVKSAELMRWLQDATERMAEQEHPISWTAPQGFPVCQAYLIKDRREIKTALHRCSVLVPAKDRALDVAAQIRGIVANLIHSYDAAHLMAVALNFEERQWKHSAWIHDSIGVHAGRVDILHRVVRDEFIAMHENPLLHDFAASLRKRIPDLPDPPVMGKLNLKDIRQSKYFFT